ncbi:hypothetical protein [Microbulbifer elongatus]|uniref:hypothetical protein n=1 Tax=Microbulbifer elongatus TaxID=86173 RepID=UPI001E29CEB0|nr:hypothetical protein [Microbulbifer elongatus]
MRFGILLILMQSLLLCAEGRAEPAGVQLDSADNVVRVLLQRDGEPPQIEKDSAAVAPQTAFDLQTPAAAPAKVFASPIFSVAPGAHAIRGPPAR